MVSTTLTFGSCDKAELNGPSMDEMLWRAPNGIVMLYGDRDNWEAISMQKAPQYVSSFCTTSTGACGLTCVQGKNGDCSNGFPCTVCMNCCVG